MSETDLGLTSRYKSMLSLMYATKRYAVDERTCPYLVVDDCQWTHLGIAERATEEAREGERTGEATGKAGGPLGGGKGFVLSAREEDGGIGLQGTHMMSEQRIHPSVL